MEALASSEAKKFAGIPDNLLQQEKDLKTQIAKQEKKLAEAYDEKSEQVVRNALFKVNREYDKLIADFEKDYPEYHEMKYKRQSLTVSQLQLLLDDETAIRSYFIGDSLISIFTITNEEVLMDKTEIDDAFDLQIFSFRRAMISSNLSDVNQYIKDAYKYYQLLFPSPLPEKIKRIVIIPDGNLGLIPFEALLTEKYSGKPEQFHKYPFLIKKYEISYNYSANLFYKQSNTNMSAKNNGGWLGIAPVFSDVKNLVINENYITPLPATEKEINIIHAKLQGKNKASKVKLFAAASEAYLKSAEIKSFKYLHIATHGFVNSEKPELSGIVLSESKEGGNDGVLYTGEIYNMEVNSDLIVLSACETGLGKISKGEGIIGLSRALLYAGTNNIMVSLWKVADESTSELMIEFYDYLLENEGQPKAIYTNSLHAAKLKMVESKKFSHPFFWSPFILVGQ